MSRETIPQISMAELGGSSPFSSPKPGFLQNPGFLRGNLVQPSWDDPPREPDSPSTDAATAGELQSGGLEYLATSAACAGASVATQAETVVARTFTNKKMGWGGKTGGFITLPKKLGGSNFMQIYDGNFELLRDFS